MLSVSAVNSKNGTDWSPPDTLTTNSYYWWDGAVQASIVHDGDTGSSSNPVYTTSFVYDAQGQLKSALIGDYLTRHVTFTNDETGQIVRRDETRPSTAPGAQTGSPHEVWYRFGGRQMGYSGNDGTSDLSTSASIAERQLVSPTTGNIGTFRNSATAASPYADFATSIDPLNSYYQGSSAGSYRVRAGDTLASIAANIYGDANLWYKIAESNGLGASSGLIEGTTLVLPTGVTRNTHNAGTFKPYDPSEAIGDLSPTTAKPPKKNNKCGVFGAILLVAIAVAVTIVTHGAAASFAGSLGLSTGAGTITATTATVAGGTIAAGSAAGIAGGVAAAVAGSVASQAFGLATGIQSKFSFKQVALAGLSAGVSGGLSSLAGTSGALGFLGRSNFVSGAARGALASVITQGVATATGLQKKFSWTGVAVGGVVGGVSGALNGRFAGTALPNSIEDYAQQTLTGAAAAIAGGAARSIIDGSDFGDNILAALPDVIGSTIGNVVARGVNLKGPQLAVDPDAYDFGDGVTYTESSPAQGGGQIAGYSHAGKLPKIGFAPAGLEGYSSSGSVLNMALGATAYNWNPLEWFKQQVYEPGKDIVMSAYRHFVPDAVQDRVEDFAEIVVNGYREAAEKFDNTGRIVSSIINAPRIRPANTIPNYGSASGMGYGRGAADLATAKSVMSSLRTLDRALSAPWHKPVTAIQPPMSIFDYPSKSPPTYKWAVNGKGAIAAGLEIGGLRGATKVGSTLVNSTEQLIPRVNVAEKFTVKAKGGGIAYAYKDPNRGHGLDMYVDNAGILGLDIRASSAYRESGTDMLLSGMQRLKADGVDVKGIRGLWLAGTDSVNYAQYAKNLQTMNVTEAALNTWTGRLASKLGYTEVFVGNPSSREVRAVFYRKSK